MFFMRRGVAGPTRGLATEVISKLFTTAKCAISQSGTHRCAFSSNRTVTLVHGFRCLHGRPASIFRYSDSTLTLAGGSDERALVGIPDHRSNAHAVADASVS